MKKIVVLLLFIITCIEVSSNDSTKVFQGYSGGMMLHTGYLFGQDKNAPITADGRSCSPQGAIWGLGGSIRVHLWKYLRTGFEGGVSNMNSGWTDCNEILEEIADILGITREKKSLPKTVKKTYETEEIGKNSVLDWIKKYANGEENE